LIDGDIADPFRSFISKSRYARWIDEYGRRETWEETVNRYVNFIAAKADLTPDEKAHLRYNVINHKVLPSMRLMMTAGEAAERSNIAIYNCATVAVDDLRAFDEALYILMNGTGLGFDVEKENVAKLPVVPSEIVPTDDVIVVEDSKEGWAQSYRELIASLYRGELPKWDLRQLRPEGARLRTFGGRSSGPAPLNELFEFTVKLIVGARGRQITTLEAHELMTMVGSIVVVGGVRRSALISLSSLDDDDIRDAKSGNWWEEKNHLALANNSAVYTRKPSRQQFDAEWAALVASGSGERGIFNRAGAKKHAPSRRDTSYAFQTNPCGEIILRPNQFCNLSEVIVRHDDTLDDLKEKVSLAAKMGTWQATMTNFPYLRDIWRENTEEEALLGVSLTGIMGHSTLNGREGKDKAIEWLNELRRVAYLANRREAKRLGINPSKAITTVKPAGTTSTLTDTSSGIHPWHDKFFVRRVRVSKTDPIAKFLIDGGLPAETDFYNERAWVFSFPFKAPEGAMTRDDMTAIDQLDHWLVFKEHWTEHNPSITVTVRDHEWDEVGDWVYENFDQITGISFLPHSDHTYEQAPFETIDEEQYESLVAQTPEFFKWSLLPVYETEDMTIANQTLSCTAGQCDVSDILTDNKVLA
jgi:ribonucleoside-diphosphate reductase alpha chain